jgi:pimeloyl-ACP methyl ester carboxylesterase
MIMENVRIYGAEPYDLVLVHGGPGAPGSLASIARRLSISFGVLEPFILSLTVNEQIEELHTIVLKNSTVPLFFIGHSWGGWLCFMYAARYPELVKKVILIGAPPFEERYVPLINETRLSRLKEEEINEFKKIVQELDNPVPGTESVSPGFLNLLFKTDIFEAITNETIDSKFYPLVYKSISQEASLIRRSGKLKEYGKDITCQVVGIHGDYDPHPAEGVRFPLSEILPAFRFCLIERCGHYPWQERYGKDILYKILYKEMGSTCV